MLREAISFGRFSDPKQKLGDSLRRQEEAYRTVCERYKERCQPSARYGFGRFFGRGQSGYHGRHLKEGGALRALLDKMESGEIDPQKVCLVIEAFDRLGRLPPDLAIRLLSDIIRSGCPIAVASPDLWADVSALESWMFSQISLCVQLAHQESQQKADRGRRSWNRRKEKRRERPPTTTCPAWLRWDGAKWVEIPGKAEVVRMIFVLCLDGLSPLKISQRLNAEGVKSLSERGEGKWSGAMVTHLLRNRACIGEARPGSWETKDGKRCYVKSKEAWIDYYRAVVSRETFTKANACLDQRRHLRGRPEKRGINLFRGLIHDARSKSTMVLHTEKKRGKTYRYLVPYDCLRNGGILYRVLYDAFEASFLYFIKGLKLAPARPNAYQAEIKKEEELIRDLNDRLERVNALDDLEDLIPLVRKTSHAMREAKARLKELEQKAAAQSPADALDECAAFTKLYDQHAEAGTLDEFNDRLRSKIRAFVAEIWCLMIKLPKRASATAVQVFLRDGTSGWFLIETRINKPWTSSDDVSAHIDPARDLRLWMP